MIAPPRLTAMVVSQSPPSSPGVNTSGNCPVPSWGIRTVSRRIFQTGMLTRLQTRIRITRAVAVSHESPTRFVIALPGKAKEQQRYDDDDKPDNDNKRKNGQGACRINTDTVRHDNFPG